MNGVGSSGVGIAERASLYVAVVAAGAAFSTLFSAPGDGFSGASLLSASGGRVFAAFFVAALVAALVGSAGRFRLVLLPPVAIVYTVVAVYGIPAPTPSGIKRLVSEVGENLYAAANTLYVDPVPYVSSPGLLVMFLPFVMVICTFATSAALYEGAPLISVATLGLTIGVLSTISFEDGIGPFFAFFIVAALVLVLYSGLAVGGGTSAGLLVAGLIAAAVLIVPKSPVADAAISPGSVDWTRIGTGGPARLDVQADVGEYLNSGRETELMRISSTEPLYWRGGTLDFFDGVRWSSTTEESEEGEEYGEEIASNVAVSSVVQSVQVLDSESDLVFGGYRISGLSSNLEDATRNADGSWSVEEPLAEGDDYRVLSEVPQPTTSQLRSSGLNYPASVREKYLQLPEDTPEVVAETAQEIRAGYDTRTPYATSRAVERYLRTDGGFTYNLDVDYRRADWAIEEFLGGEQEGFCTQYATSMVLILREMDVPARLVYGATTGTQTDTNVYLVRGANMHTWVEVYFPGVGWYPFDPTPGFSMPETMQSSVPRLDPALDSGVQDIPRENRALDEPQPEASEMSEPEGIDDPAATDGGSASGGSVWLLYILFPVAALCVVPGVKLLLLRRGRPEDLYRDITGRLTDALVPGSGVAATADYMTVEERMGLLSGANGLDGRAFAPLAASYSEHLYAESSGDGRALGRAYRRSLVEYRRLPLWRRVLAAINPTSLTGRGKAKLSGTGEGLRRKLIESLPSKLRRSG